MKDFSPFIQKSDLKAAAAAVKTGKEGIHRGKSLFTY